MSFLADTNILLRVLQRADPDHALVRAALRKLKLHGERIYYASQNLVEFWRVCTRPKSSNGLAMSVSDTDRGARIVERIFSLAVDAPDVHAEWRRIVVVNNVSGIQVHDARLAAVMRVHAIAHILTLNVADFRRYRGVNPVHPRDV